MEYNTTKLSNGLRIIHLPSASPVVFCGYDIAAGTRHEQESEEGLAHFCEHVTFKGTSRRTSMQIINALERLGGELNAFTNKEETVYYAAVTSEHVAKAVDILSDMVFRSIYPEAELKKETEVICDEIESYNDSPSELIYDEFENIVFRGHPLGHGILGEVERLHTYNTQTALSFTNRMYTPDKMVFFAYGNVNFKKLVRILEKETSDIRCIANANPGSFTQQPIADAHAIYRPQRITTNKDCHQAHVLIGNIGYGLHDERRMPLYLLNNILGGPGMNSRLNLALREKCGLVYTVESSVIGYSDTGLWSIYFGCDPHDIGKCMKIVRRELDKFMQKPLTDSQLRSAKRQIMGQLAIAGDNRENFALDFAKTYLHFNKGKDMHELAAKIHAISVSEIQDTAQRIFADDALSVLIYK